MADQKVQITVDISELSLGDVEKLMKGNDLPFTDQLDLLDKVITSEGGARAVKIKDFPMVFKLIQEEMEKAQNPLSVPE